MTSAEVHCCGAFDTIRACWYEQQRPTLWFFSKEQTKKFSIRCKVDCWWRRNLSSFGENIHSHSIDELTLAMSIRSLREALEAYDCNLTQDVPIVQEIRNEVRKLNTKDVIWQKITKLERDLRFTADMERLIAPSMNQVSDLPVSKTLFLYGREKFVLLQVFILVALAALVDLLVLRSIGLRMRLTMPLNLSKHELHCK